MLHRRDRVRIGIGAVALAAVLAGLLPPPLASASHVQARDTADACSGAPEDGFTDTGTDGSALEQAVDCISWYQITRGTSATRYSPSQPITRAQMATMIAEKMRQSERAFAEPAASEDFFADDESSVHEANINFVAKHGVVQGTRPGRFSPDDPVTRAQMATFIVNQLQAMGVFVPPTAPDAFDDDNGNTHERNINRIAALGIATGTADRSYVPGSAVTRLQMALFVSRDLDYLVEQQAMRRPDQRLTVSLDKTSVKQGETVNGSVAAGTRTIASGRVNGCSIVDQPLTDTNASQAGIQFTLTIPAAQQPGNCTLVFTARFADNSSESVSRQINVTASSAGEATAGTHTAVKVASVNRAADNFTSASDSQGHTAERFDYDSNDTFRRGATGITLAAFEGMLTGPAGSVQGDVVDVTYAPEPTGVSTFTMVTDNVPTPQNFSVTVADLDGDGAADDVAMSWTEPQPDAVYDVWRDDLPDDAPQDVERQRDDHNAESLTLLNQPNGTYNYLLRAQSPTSAAMSALVVGQNVTVPGPAQQPVGRPRSENAVQTSAGQTAAEVGTGDVWRLAFSEDIAAISQADSLIVIEGTDAIQAPNEDAVTLQHDVNADLRRTAGGTIAGKVYGNDEVLEVRILEDTGLTLPVTIVASTGMTDDDGNPVDWGGSFDRTVRNETIANSPRSDDVDVTNDSGTGDLVSPGDTIRVLFDQQMNDSPTSPVADQVTIRDAGNDQVTLVHGQNATFAYSDSVDPPGQDLVLTITVGDVTTSVNYGPGTTITGVVYVIDVEGWVWDLANSADVVVDEEVDDDTAPSIASAAGATNGTNPDTITVTYNEPVTCTAQSRLNFVYDQDGNPLTTADRFSATGIACNNTTTVVLTFADGVFTPGVTGNPPATPDDRLTYNHDRDSNPTTPAQDPVEDLAGNDATSSQTVSVSG